MNSTKFYTGRLRSDVQPLTVLYTIFDRKGTLLVLAIIGITPGLGLLSSTVDIISCYNQYCDINPKFLIAEPLI